MYLMFYLVFLVPLLQVATNGYKVKLHDEHPFFDDDDDDTKEGNDKFMLIPSLGFESEDKPGKYSLFLSGWYHEPLESNFFIKSVKTAFKVALHFIDSNEEFSKEEQKERLAPFLVKDVPNHDIELRLGDPVSEIVTTDENGQFNKEIIVDSLEGLDVKGGIAKYIAADTNAGEKGASGFVYLMKNERGCSIISDIDDTIKISEIAEKDKFLVNTFTKDYEAVSGMSELYRSWQSSHQCLTHYVTTMPSQLYYAMQNFVNREKFPHGSFHMRHFELVNTITTKLIDTISDFIQDEFSGGYKFNTIQDILEHAPSARQFVLVGDSGQQDPEIYGKIAREHPDSIHMIFIRLVPNGNNDETRFETAFKDVPTDKWKTFSNAEELPEKLFEDGSTTVVPTNNDDVDTVDHSTKNHAINIHYHILSIVSIFIFTIDDRFLFSFE